jgi:E-phenylitaconyl-CoA hydratase
MSELVAETIDGISIITLNRPEAHNALSIALRDSLEAQLLAFDADPAKRVAILTGAGNRSFCAGADLKTALPIPSGPAALFDSSVRPLVRDLGLSKPVIAAINGSAFGGGLELALLCDIRIAADTAVFALSEVKIGSMAGSGGTQRLTRLIGLANALQMGLTGDRISADEALRIGLVTRVVPSVDLMETAIGIARKIASNAPLSVQATRKAMRDGFGMPLSEGLALERTLFTLLRDSEDRAEGRAAFREKRSPVFKGK